MLASNIHLIVNFSDKNEFRYGGHLEKSNLSVNNVGLIMYDLIPKVFIYDKCCQMLCNNKISLTTMVAILNFSMATTFFGEEGEEGLEADLRGAAGHFSHFWLFLEPGRAGASGSGPAAAQLYSPVWFGSGKPRSGGKISPYRFYPEQLKQSRKF